MMSGNLFQFDDDQNLDAAAVGDIRDYLTCDLKLSDTALNDILSDFDMNQNFDPVTTHFPYAQIPSQTTDPNSIDFPPPSYETLLLHQHQNSTPMSNTYHEEFYPNNNTWQSYIEQQQNYSSSPSPPQVVHSTNYSETLSLLPMDPPDHSAVKDVPMKKSPIPKRTRPTGPAHLPKLIKKPEPISVTLGQFQALMCSAPDNSTSHQGTFSNLLENSTIIGNNIPLKIVSHSSDENSRHDSPMNNNNANSIPNGSGRVRRKSSHNAIEKRYRSSINERILELKEIVASDDGKVQKSGVLRRTIEYIRELQTENRRLKKENNTFQTILKRLNFTHTDISIGEESPSSDRGGSGKSFTTPPSSQSDSSESTLGSSDEAFSPVPKKQKRTTSRQGMVNGTRVVLCCFMLCVLISNPFSYLLNLIQSSDSLDSTELRSIVGSRTLQSSASSSNNENLHSPSFLSASWRQLVAWMLNIAICLVCLVKLFVYGEPIVSEAEMRDYDVCKKKADQLMSENRLNDARDFYRQCCEKLYVTIDENLLYYFSSITWQMTRYCVNLIFLGRWLTFWSGWTKSIDTRDYNRELNDCLLQLWKIEYEQSTSSLTLFNLFISTLNTSMNSGKKLDLKKRNEIYFLSALTLKRLAGIFPLFIPYVLKCLQMTDLNDFWLVDHERLNEFLFEKEHFPFEQGQVLDSIRHQYLDYILYENLRNQLMGKGDDFHQSISIENLDRFSWWQHIFQVIRCISDDCFNVDSLSSSEALRSGQNLSSTIYSTARTKNFLDERTIEIIETIHRILLVLNDDPIDSDRLLLLERLGQKSRSMIDENPTEIDLAMKTLILDGILSLRLRLLTSSMDASELPFLSDFQEELDQYRSFNRQLKLPKERIYIFESIFRVASGLNPLNIQTLFEGAVKQQISNKNSANLEIIAALLLFCHFSPSTIFHYRSILHQSANRNVSNKKNNDLYRLRQQSLTLIRQSYATL